MSLQKGHMRTRRRKFKVIYHVYKASARLPLGDSQTRSCKEHGLLFVKERSRSQKRVGIYSHPDVDKVWAR